MFKTAFMNDREIYEDMIDHRSYAHHLSSCEIKARKNSGLNGIRTYDLCDTGAVLYQLSYQASGSWPLCEFVIYPERVKNTNEYMKVHIFDTTKNYYNHFLPTGPYR